MAVLAFVVLQSGVVLATSDRHGTGASSVRGTAVDTSAVAPCPPTLSTPGGANNHRPDTVGEVDLGRGLEITGVVRDTSCRPLPGVRLQVWLQTADAVEREHQTSVCTGPDGRYRVLSDPARPSFGEPHVHVAHDDRRDRSNPDRDRYTPVFVRHVIAADDRTAVVDLALDAPDAG